MYFQKIKNINNRFIKSYSYIPEYDLFRALAIVLVVLFHFFENKLQSGFIGVDIFFTLSGCVISRSIISEISKNQNFSVINFYRKRILRIFPNICLYVLITFILLIFSGDAESIKDISKDVIRSLFFISNFSIKNPDDYFKINDGQFFSIFWSLSIEEQFYFIFPFIIIFSLILVRKNNNIFYTKKNFNFKKFINIFSILILAITIISFTSFTIQVNNQNFHYANTLSRIWQIAIGVLITLLVIKKNNYNLSSNSFLIKNIFIKRICLIIPLILLIIISFQPLEKLSYPNNYSLIVSGLTFIGLTFSPGAIIKNHTNYLYPFLFIGKISYGWYLWHWLILESARYYSFSISSPFIRLFLLIISLFFTIFIDYFYENPIRNNKYKFSYVYWSIIYFSLNIPALISSLFYEYLPISNLKQKEISNKYYYGKSLNNFLIENGYSKKLMMKCDLYDLKSKENYEKNIVSFFKNECFYNQNIQPPRKKLNIGFFGDSHAQQFINALPKDNYNISPLIGSGCLLENILKDSKPDKKFCNDLKKLIDNKKIIYETDILVIAFDITNNLDLLFDFLITLEKNYKNLKIIMIGPVPHWENYLPKIAIRNLRGNIKDVYSRISLNNANFLKDEKIREMVNNIKSSRIYYFSPIDILCDDDINKKCLVGFINKKGSISLTSYDKSHLTLSTTGEIIRPKFEELINSITLK